MLRHDLFDDGVVQWTVFGRDPSRPDNIIDTNEYLINCDGQAMVLDPGGADVFPVVLAAISQCVELSQIEAYLCSHQDPDVMSSLPLWMALTPEAKIYMPWLWTGFVAHFDSTRSADFVAVPDEGMDLTLGSRSFTLVPAHHCHSAGNFNLFDPVSRILFSGDMGAALVPEGSSLFVEDFATHTSYAEGFHRRWMPSNAAKEMWVRRIRRLNPSMICPQHGAIYRGDDVGRFLDWLEQLDVGRTQLAA